MKNKRGFVGVGVLIAILVGLAVLGGGAYFVIQQNTTSQTATDTNDLETLPVQDTDGASVEAPVPAKTTSENKTSVSVKPIDTKATTDEIKNTAGINLTVDKIPETFFWSEANPNIHLSYTVEGPATEKSSAYSLCASMRDIANQPVTEEDCSPLTHWGFFEVNGNPGLAPDSRRKDFWNGTTQKVTIYLRVVKGAFGSDGAPTISSIDEGDTGFFSLNIGSL